MPVLVGALVDGPGDQVSNTGIVWDPVTGPGATYVKQHPVPFGEYMPFRDVLRRLSDKVDLVPRDFARGERTGLLQVGPAAVGDVICFEVAYDGLVRDAVRAGGQLLVVQTNNATFGRSAQTAQQLAMGRLRAVEHGRAVLVAATSGISAVIAPDGTLTDAVGGLHPGRAGGRRAGARRADAGDPRRRAAGAGPGAARRGLRCCCAARRRTP